MGIEGRCTDIAHLEQHAFAYRFAIEDSQVSRLLDVGIGSGVPLLRVIDSLKSEQRPLAIGVDIYRPILRDLFDEASLEPINADGLHLPFENESFPLVIACQVIEHMEKAHHLDFMRELARVAEPHGKIVVSTMNKDFPFNVKGHRDHKAEFNTQDAVNLAEECKEFGDSEVFVVIPSERYIDAQKKRAMFWFFRPIKDFVPRRASDLVLTILTKGRINPGLDMSEDFKTKRLQDLTIEKSELFTDFIFVIKKRGRIS